MGTSDNDISDARRRRASALAAAAAAAAGEAQGPSQGLDKPHRSSSDRRLHVSASLMVAVALLLFFVSQTHGPALWRMQSTLEAPVSTGDIDCNAAAQPHLTSERRVLGFHVMCIRATPSETLLVTAFKDGMGANATVETAHDLMSFRLQVESLLGVMPPTDPLTRQYKQPYGVFTPNGTRLDDWRLSTLLRHQIVYFFEGGQFIWPGIRVGHKRIVPDVHGRGDVVLETISMVPLVFSVQEFLRDDEIEVILELSRPHLQPSVIVPMDIHRGRPATDWRTSSTYFLPSTAHPIVEGIDRRTADLVRVPRSHQETVQVLRYEPTQKYDHHLDYFTTDGHRDSPDVLERIEHGHKNRMITVFWYMSDVGRGGETIFPRAGGAPAPASLRDCTTGLKVRPQKRKVIVFYSMLPNGQGDPMSLHGGCPVEEGTKYSGNKWVWNKPRQAN